MFFRFLLVGLAGFIIDAGITAFLVCLDSPAWSARVPAIIVAMAFTWLANRRFTYEVKSERSAGEAFRYAAAATAMAAVNYVLYLALVAHDVGVVPAVALSTACQTLFSFHVYRHVAFGKPASRGQDCDR